MPDPVISVKHIGKKYRLGATHGDRGFTTLRDAVALRAKALVRRGKPNRPASNNTIPQPPINSENSNEFWALRDISFDVHQGEVLGIIGPNGAGKSTLLKILSEITEPTEGIIRIKGRVASLLEVGTGFHPELSGKENIFMNGAILGMRKSEIKMKFDEIVAFAGIEKFVDTPVKRYSSGMYVRLAFAVAAHLEPELLLVDEVLAVGDVEFQTKCLGKMREVSQGGRTVLFVSHNMGAIRQLTSRCLLLEEGLKIFDGDKTECISRYLTNVISDAVGRRDFPDNNPSQVKPVSIKSVTLGDGTGRQKSVFSVGEIWVFEIELEALDKGIMLYATLHIQNEYGTYVFHLVSRDTGRDCFYSDFYLKLRITLPKLLLYPGKYSVDVYVSRADSSLKDIDTIMSAISFEVNQSAGLISRHELGKGDAVVHEVATWEVEDERGGRYLLNEIIQK